MTFSAVADTLSSSSSSTSSTSATATTLSSSSATSSPVSSSSSSAAKFTAAQLAGTGVGVGVPLLLALMGTMFVIYRQNKRLSALSAPDAMAHVKNRRYETPDLLSMHSPPPAAPRQSVPFSGYASNAPRHGQPHYQPVPQGGRFVEQMKEMDTSQQRVEMDSDGKVHELSTRRF
nr:hypothetical protein CFP56_04233 [Quercus suber]